MPRPQLQLSWTKTLKHGAELCSFWIFMRFRARSWSELLNFSYYPTAPEHTRKHTNDHALCKDVVSDRSHALKERPPS